MPIDGQEVWVRRIDYAEAFACFWDETAGEFYTLEGLRMPWWAGARWKVHE
jgi:hypothetical protein